MVGGWPPTPPPSDAPVPFSDKFGFKAPLFTCNEDEWCVEPCDDDELDDEVEDEQGAMVVVAVVELLLEGGGGAVDAEETLKLELLLAVPFMCCCSFWAAKFRSTRLMEETWREGRWRIN